MKKKLSKELKLRLIDLLENHPPEQLSQDLRNIYFEYLYHANVQGISIYFRRRLLSIQDLCNWLDSTAYEIQQLKIKNK
jgi:hypothetical protein